MSYLEVFTANTAVNCDAIKGTCCSMCPQEEVTKREEERLVHMLEVVGSDRHLVKSYSRSAADTTLAVPALLRPYNVLYTTVCYLFLEVTQRTDVPSPAVYDFVNDRLRAVRQDMTVQRLAARQCATLLEPMVRFYVFYGYKLCELPLKDYDPMLNHKCLLECLKWFLSSCDALDLNEPWKVDELALTLSGLDIVERKLKCDRVLMESLYILCNLGDIHPLHRYLSLPKNLKREPRLYLAYEVAAANLRGDFLRVCRMVDLLCPLAACALCVYLPHLQRRALHVLSHAYSSKTLTVPVEVLCRWLRFGNVAEAASSCAYYGVTLDGNMARFNKNQFKSDAATVQPRKLLQLHQKLDLTINHVFTY